LCSQEKVVNEAISDEDLRENETSVCVVCKKRSAESVMSLTKTGIEVVVSGVVCGVCATGVDSQEGQDEDDLSFSHPNLRDVDEKKDKEDDISLSFDQPQDKPDTHQQQGILESELVEYEPSTFRSQIRGILYKNLWLSLSQMRSIVVRLIT